jgi:hypothetical protein
MLCASRHVGDKWLLVVRAGRDLLIDTESVEVAYERLLRGEQPPLMLCERRRASAGNGPMRAIQAIIHAFEIEQQRAGSRMKI